MLLAASGDLDDRMYGAYIPTSRTDNGETIVAESHPGVRRRSIYLQQKRTQVHSLLQVFDAPSIVFNNTRRARSTMPLQSLSLLNSEFVVARSQSLSRLLEEENLDEPARRKLAFLLTSSRPPSDKDNGGASQFLYEQQHEYADDPNGRARAWSELCQILLVNNAALYLE